MDKTAPTRDLIDRLAALGDANRLRMLALLERNEFTVSELTSVLQLPQSTVSRHLKVLADGDWIRWRKDGTSRHYRLAMLEPDADELWRVSRGAIDGALWLEEDAERARSVLAARHRRSEEFFSEAAGRWDALRVELFGRHVEPAALLGLLDADWTVGDLGAGTGSFSAAIAPFVSRVIAVDRSPEMLAAARERTAGFEHVEVREGDLEALPIETGALDVALLLLVLPYVVEPRRVLEEARRTLAPGGRLVIVDMRRHDREEYRDTMGHLWLGFEEDELGEWATDAGLEGYRHVGLTPDPDASGPLLFVGTAKRGAA